MKNVVLFAFVVVLLSACGTGKKADNAEAKKDTMVYTIDQLYDNAAALADSEVIVKGTVFHVCKEGGGRCFLMGSNENISIRVEAGEKIGAFTQEQMGSELQITGILKIVKSEADAHNPGREHGTEDSADSVTAKAHEVISAAQDSVEVVYFIEGLSVKDLTTQSE
jgi:hypothetical protein